MNFTFLTGRKLTLSHISVLVWTDEEHVGREVITLMRAVIHECHRALCSHSDLTVPGGSENSEEQPTQMMELPCLVEGSRSHVQHEAVAAAEKERKTNEHLCAVHAILGTAMFIFGKIIYRNASLALQGEPATPLPYWLSALDVFESGYNLPARTNASYSHKENWLLSVSHSRVLVALIGQFITEEEKKRSTIELFTRGSKWASNSPLGTIVSMRPPPTQRMALSLMSTGELMLIATDQFMRGILHMPHHNSTEFPYFSRVEELLTIATEVLEVVERLPLSVQRPPWAIWVESILNLIKAETATDEQNERCHLARVWCRSLIYVDQKSEVV
ncbi:hypothetical protein SCLCIDRAFT_1010005 [Scleroderma citrinum Foug A]|uniref:Transcription factor domain-containing protein n=1 Tax=Scleroderma citrinum Foug A TaxID=1036808 RepID=A0A0C3E605_9AGAM|nr:hypothetical protein SCLCIDRAFT_1010005 [Scleroderma citrinum Foug A]